MGEYFKEINLKIGMIEKTKEFTEKGWEIYHRNLTEDVDANHH